MLESCCPISSSLTKQKAHCVDKKMAAKNKPSEHAEEGETDVHEGADDLHGEVADEAVAVPEVRAEP